MPRNVPISSSLSTSRIQRLLRPLRTHCTTLVNCLAAHTQATTRVTAISHSKIIDDNAPLQVIPLPSTFAARGHFYRERVETIELSRKLYAVRDCFRNIIINTTAGHPSNTNQNDGQSRVMALTTMCAVIFGQVIEGQCQEEVDEDEDAEEVEILTEFYEAIPPEYRRPAVLAHGLDIILSTAPHHPTLLTILLDVCLVHSLQYQANTLLSALLRVSISPQPTARVQHPPLCHSMHASFLEDLRKRWRAAGRLDQEFYTILTQALLGATSLSIWTSKAVASIATSICDTDFSSFLRLGSCLANQMKQASSPRSARNASETHFDSDIRLEAANLLHRWVGIAFDRILFDVDSSVLSAYDVAATMGSFVCFSLAIPLSSWLSNITLTRNIQNRLLCLATHWLYHCKTQAPSDVVSYSTYLLQGSTPRPITFHVLLKLVVEQMHMLLLSDVDEFHQRLFQYADLLRSMGLLHLEASLWGCALRLAESPGQDTLFSQWATEGSISKYRRRLIELVDDVEKRCFGQASGSTPRIVDLAIREEFDDEDRSTRSKSGVQWQWEEMIGGWVQVSKTTPLIKRPMKVTRQRPAEGDSDDDIFDVDTPVRYHRKQQSQPFSTSTPSSTDNVFDTARMVYSDSSPCVSPQATKLVMTSPDELHLGPASARQPSRYARRYQMRPRARASEPILGRDYASNLVTSPTPLPRSEKSRSYRPPHLSNFTTLLSDAILSRTVLHGKRRIVDDTLVSTPLRKRARMSMTMMSGSRGHGSRTETIRTPFYQSPSPLESPEPEVAESGEVDVDLTNGYTPAPVKAYSSDDPFDLFMVNSSPMN